MLSQLRGEPETAAENVGYGNPDLKRLWTVGRFPRNFATGEPLENITINQTNEDGFIQERFISKTALWDPDTTKWHLTDVIP